MELGKCDFMRTFKRDEWCKAWAFFVSLTRRDASSRPFLLFCLFPITQFTVEMSTRIDAGVFRRVSASHIAQLAKSVKGGSFFLRLSLDSGKLWMPYSKRSIMHQKKPPPQLPAIYLFQCPICIRIYRVTRQKNGMPTISKEGQFIFHSSCLHPHIYQFIFKPRNPLQTPPGKERTKPSRSCPRLRFNLPTPPHQIPDMLISTPLTKSLQRLPQLIQILPILPTRTSRTQNMLGQSLRVLRPHELRVGGKADVEETLYLVRYDRHGSRGGVGGGGGG